MGDPSTPESDSQDFRDVWELIIWLAEQHKRFRTTHQAAEAVCAIVKAAQWLHREPYATLLFLLPEPIPTQLYTVDRIDRAFRELLECLQKLTYTSIASVNASVQTNEAKAETSRDDTTTPEPSSGHDTNAAFNALSKVVRLAYWSYLVAEKKAGHQLEDQKAWNLLDEEGLPQSADLGELADYELPNFETWSRYVREARKALGENKYTPRAGRPKGGSIVRPDEI
jgi:hypothetical protein